MTDHDLLQAYAHQGSHAQAAFAELVARHLNLVYSAALRQVRSSQLAEDVAQSVFLDLARHARDFRSDQPLAAWLHVVTRRTAVDTIRRESRRQAREQAAYVLSRDEPAASTAMSPPSASSTWSHLEPLLDEAVAALPDADRQAILLRYFENKSLREIGASLGTSDDAAQKRVSRALDQLRTLLLRRGLTVTAASLATDLSAHAIVTAPATLTGTIATASAALGTATLPITTATVATKTILMTTLQKSLITAALVMVGGVSLYQANLIAGQSSDLAALAAQNDRTAATLSALRSARLTTDAKLKTVERQIDDRLTLALPVSAGDAALQTQMLQWLAKIDRLKEILAQRPELNIPEIKLLSDENWFLLAFNSDPLDSEEAVRRITSTVRHRAENTFAPKLKDALNAYLKAHDDQLPPTPQALAPYLDPTLDPAVLDRYEMLQQGRHADLPRSDRAALIGAKTPVDPELDAYWTISATSYGNTSAINANLTAARRAFARANSGAQPTTAAQITPYLRWPVTEAALEKFFSPTPVSPR